jgi:hypothetical protein
MRVWFGGNLREPFFDLRVAMAEQGGKPRMKAMPEKTKKHTKQTVKSPRKKSSGYEEDEYLEEKVAKPDGRAYDEEDEDYSLHGYERNDDEDIEDPDYK